MIFVILCDLNIPNWFVLEDFPSLGNLLQSVDDRPEKEENAFDPLYLGMCNKEESFSNVKCFMHPYVAAERLCPETHVIRCMFTFHKRHEVSSKSKRRTTHL